MKPLLAAALLIAVLNLPGGGATVASSRSSATKATPSLKSETKAWPQEPDNIKGLKIGMTLAEAKKVSGVTNCQLMHGKYEGEGACDFDKFFLSFDKSLRLRSINFSFEPNEFDKINRQLIEEYGKPTKTIEFELANDSGRPVTQNISDWSGENIRMALCRFEPRSVDSTSGAGMKFDLTEGFFFIVPVSH